MIAPPFSVNSSVASLGVNPRSQGWLRFWSRTVFVRVGAVPEGVGVGGATLVPG